MRVTVERRLDLKELLGGLPRLYLDDLLFDLFDELHRQLQVEPSVGRGYLVLKEVVGLDINVKMTSFESTRECREAVRVGNTCFGWTRECCLELDRDHVVRYVDRLKGRS